MDAAGNRFLGKQITDAAKGRNSRCSLAGRGTPSKRKKLADISNFQLPSNQQQSATADYLEKIHMENMALVKENMTLVKLLAERNKLLEVNGIELQKLRVDSQKLQQQNLQLVQANTQMLRELNSGKDKLLVLNHELGCKTALSKATEVVSKTNKITSLVPGNQVKAHKLVEADEFVEAADGDNESSKTNRRRQSRRRNSRFFTTQPILDKEDLEGKSIQFEGVKPMEDRLPLRRQSDSFKFEEPELSQNRICPRRLSTRLRAEKVELVDDLSETMAAKFPASPLCDAVVPGSGQTSDNPSDQQEEKERNDSPKNEARKSRTSTGRPSRKAAEKVQSYKEIPLKVKLRRPE